MDLDALADVLAARVRSALTEIQTPAAAEAGSSCTTTGFCSGDAADTSKPILLGLTQDSDLPPCRFTLMESARVKEKYRLKCAQKLNYEVDIHEFEAVVLHDLTNESLAKIANGICDTPYTRLVSQALLLGKTVYLMQDQIELYNYRQTAAKVYYKMFREKLGMLEQSGLVIVCPDKIEDLLVNGSAEKPTCGQEEKEAKAAAPVAEAPKTGANSSAVTLEKHLITERDVVQAIGSGASRIVVGAKAIVTDLAKDYALSHTVELVRA